MGDFENNSEEIKRGQRIKQFDWSQDKFISMLAHDLRGPIGNIMQLSQLMNDPALQNKEVLKMLQLSAKNTMNLLDDILDWTKSKNGYLKPRFSSFDLKALIDEEVAHISYSISGKNVSINSVGIEQCIINADKNMLGTIIRNIVGNAVKYSLSNGQVDIIYTHNTVEHIISIQDQGVGIAENIAKALLTENTASTDGTQGERGTGWGLMLCKSLVELHQGKIWFESAPTQGTIFSFSIPKNLAV